MPLNVLPMACGWVLRGAATAAALLGTSRGAAQSPDSAIPDQLALMAAACRENSARIQSLQLSGRVIRTGRLFAGQWDRVTNQTYNDQTREFTLWKDALNLRFDVTADWEVDGATGEINYNVPYGEHITSYAKLAREGGLDALKRKYGTPQSTHRTIATPEQGYRYTPESNTLHLNVPRRDLTGVYDELEVQLGLNKVLWGSTLDECTDRWAELAQRGEPRALVVTPLGGGQYHIRSTVSSQPDSASTHQHTRDIVVDLDKGGNVLYYVDQTDGQTVMRGQFDYMNVAGAWVVSHAEVAGLFDPNGVPLVHAVYEVTPESVRINEPIDPRVFTFEGLDVRKGALVVDHKTGEEYLYDDIPLHLKVALAAAREWQEEAAEEAARTGQTGPPGQAEPLPEMAQLSAEDWQAAPGQAGAPPGGAAPPRGVTPAGPAARGITGPNSIVMLTPETRPARQADTKADQPPVATRPVATQPVPEVQVLQKEDRAAEPALAEAAPVQAPAAGRWGVPSAAVTAVVVSAGCAAALGIVIWKLLRRAAPPRAG